MRQINYDGVSSVACVLLAVREFPVKCRVFFSFVEVEIGIRIGTEKFRGTAFVQKVNWMRLIECEMRDAEKFTCSILNMSSGHFFYPEGISKQYRLPYPPTILFQTHTHTRTLARSQSHILETQSTF